MVTVKLTLALAGLAALLLSSVALLAQQPPLADVAKKERARRATITKPSPVYTNDDLRGGMRLTTAASHVATDTDERALAADADLGGDDPPPEETESRDHLDQEYWHGRITEARTDKRRAELNAAALQNRVDGLWATFTSRDDPIQRAQIERDRNLALEGLQDARDEIERLDQEIRDIHEEARRASVPPGWLR